MPIQEDEADWRAIPDLIAEQKLDLLVWTKTWHLDVEAQTEMLDTLRRQGVPSIAVHLDKYWDLDREHQIHDEPWWRCAVVFSADGGNQERFAEAAIEHVWFQPGVYGTEAQKPGNRRPEYISDVCFVGSHRYHAEWTYRRELLTWLNRTYRGRFKLWPRGKAIREQDLNDLYASVKVVVGDSCGIGDPNNYWSDRVPETLGRGGFLLHPYVPGLEEHYEDGVHLRLFDRSDYTELRRLIDYYVEHDEERQQIAKAGQAHVLANHTYRHRMAEVIAEVLRRFPKLKGWPGEIREKSFDELILSEIYEQDVYRARSHLHEGATVVDLGANVGFFSVWAAQHGAQVLAVEPFDENLELLDRNLKQADLNGQVEVLAGAVGSTKGRAEMVPDQGDNRGGGARVVQSDAGKVTVHRLDDVLERYDEIDILKIDIEGSEYPMIARSVELRRAKYIAVEFHATTPNHFGDMVARLAATHALEIIGRPTNGGYIYATRYEP